MFVLMTMTDMLRTSPEQFGEDLNVLLMEQVEKKYTNKILPGSGLGAAFYDFLELGDPFVYPAEGGVHQFVKFRMIYFRPFIGEVLRGRILSSNDKGIRISLYFFDDIFVPAYLMQWPSEYREQDGFGNWVWKYGEENGDDFVFVVGSLVRFRVKSIDYTKTTETAKGFESSIISESMFNPPAVLEPVLVRQRSNSLGRDDGVLAPMKITAAFNEEGLGPIDWWRSD